MRQSNGSELFHVNDPRSRAIGIIEVEPDDDRQSVITALLTQEKVGRKQTVVIVPGQNSAFRRTADFESLQHTLEGLETEVVFITPKDSAVAKFARRQHLPLFLSLDKYKQYAQTFLSRDEVEEAAPETPPPAETRQETAHPDTIGPPPSPRHVEDEQTRPLPPKRELPVPEIEHPFPSASLRSSYRPAEDIPIGSVEVDNTQQRYKATPANAAQDKESQEEEQPIQRAYQPLPQSGPAEIVEQGPEDEKTLVPVATGAAEVAHGEVLVPLRRRGRGRGWLRAALVLLLLVLIGGTILSIIEGVGPLAPVFGTNTAVVTITPDSTVLDKPYTLTAVTMPPDITKRQVTAHFLSSNKPGKTKTVTATGKGTIGARQARGELIFYSWQTRPQTIPSGSIFTDSSGIQVISDQDVVLEAAQPPQAKSAIVQAHVVIPGAKGNTFAINMEVCCQFDIRVQNLGTFSGGEDEQTFTYVQQSDIDGAVGELTNTLKSDSFQSVQSQVQPSEQLAEPIQCTPTVDTNQVASDRASTVIVTVTEICVGEVYDHRGAEIAAENLLEQDAGQNPGANYSVSGPINTEIKNMGVDQQGTVTLNAHARGRWVYQFGQGWKEKVAQALQGKTISEAREWLEKQAGVKGTKIDESAWTGDTLPADAKRIQVVVESVGGV